MTKLKYFRLVCVFTLVLTANIVMLAQPSSGKNQNMLFHIGIKGVLDKLTGIELYESDFKLIDTRANSVIKSVKASDSGKDRGILSKLLLSR